MRKIEPPKIPQIRLQEGRKYADAAGRVYTAKKYRCGNSHTANWRLAESDDAYGFWAYRDGRILGVSSRRIVRLLPKEKPCQSP